MWKFLFVTLAVVVLVFSFKPASVSASDPITGKWNFVFDTEGGPREFAADLKLDGDKVSGRFADKADIKGTFKEQKINLAFPFQSDEIDLTDTLTITGKLEKDTLSGDWSFSQYSGTYKAHRN